MYELNAVHRYLCMSLNREEACLIDSWIMSPAPAGHDKGKQVLAALLNPKCKQKCNNRHISQTERLCLN